MRPLSEINRLNSKARAGKGRPQAIDIENVDQKAVENYVRDLALLTMTNAEDWNLRLVAARCTSGEGLIWFTHATQAPHVAILYLQNKEEERGDCESHLSNMRVPNVVVNGNAKQRKSTKPRRRNTPKNIVRS